MTAVTIKGVEYDLEGTFANPELNALMFLKAHEGLTLRELYDGFQLIGKAEEAAQVRRDAGDPDAPTSLEVMFDLLSDEVQLNAFRGFVWLLKTNQGERAADGRFLTIEAANKGVGLNDILFPEEPADAVDPTEGDSAPPS